MKMNWYRAVDYLGRAFCWLVAIGLIAITSASIKADWNGTVYVINAAFLLFGGRWLGDKFSERMQLLQAKKTDREVSSKNEAQ